MRVAVPSLLLLLLACDDGDKGALDTIDSGEQTCDGDGDGYCLEDGDCDDDVAEINPAAAELCDGLDNDCDEQVDEDLGATRYTDADGDGYGDPATGVVACEGVGVPTAGDCDDADSEINPDAAEICDGMDNDCDEQVDEDLKVTRYTDADGDGYGDADAPVEVCEETDGVDDASDCDDADGETYPGAPETCGDGADQDCDGADLACERCAGTVAESDVAAAIQGAAGQYTGARVRPAGDMDGDGRDDLLINAYGAGPSTADFSGGVMLVPGTTSGDVALADVATATLYGAESSEYAGWGLSRGEDLDGDGWPDVAIGAYGRSDPSGVAGGAYVVYGPLAGSATLDSSDGLILPDDAAISNLGYETSSSPDLTGDGVGDVVLGSYGSSSDSFRGAAWIIAGPISGTVTLDTAITITGDTAIDLAGNGLDGVGDVDGDGAWDLVVGAHGDDAAGDAAGSAGVFYGPLTGDLAMADADRTLLGAAADDEFSRNGVNGRGDVDGDGVDDVLVGAMFSSPGGTYSGGAFLFSGDATATSTSAASATARIDGESSSAYTGRTVDIVGDADGDGFDDLIVSSHGATGGATGSGLVGLFYGPVSGSLVMSDADCTLEGASASEGLGISAAGVGDTNGDGRADLLVGAWFNAGGGSYAGAAFLMLGG